MAQWQFFVAPCMGIGLGDWVRQVHVSVGTGSLFQATCRGLLFHSLIKEQAARKT